MIHLVKAHEEELLGLEKENTVVWNNKLRLNVPCGVLGNKKCYSATLFTLTILFIFMQAHRQYPTRPASSFTLFHLSLATVLCKVKQH